MDPPPALVVARRFSASATEVAPHLGGHIHDTWFVATGGDGPDLVLQRLNNSVFPDCLHMMDNVLRVTAHLERRLPCVARVARTVDAAVVVYDAEGRPWRAFERVPGASSHQVVPTPAAGREVGRAMGRFLVAVQGVRGGPLVEPIPGFKDFRRRKADFEFLVDLDPFGRAATCKDEILGVRDFHRLVKELDRAIDAGQLPLRIVHNDAKAANVLLDDVTGEARCVVDLDTVAPGCVLFDIGDLLRSATVTLAEDGAGMDGVAVRDDLLEAVLGGYLSEAGGLLCPSERDLIPMAGPLMAYEAAMRFLTDHLAGDTYFRIERPRQNLDRARVQLRVLAALSRASERVAQLVSQA